MATPLIFCQCEAPAAVLRQRIVARQATAQDPSEADLSILELQSVEREPILDDERLRVASVDTTRDDALAVALGNVAGSIRGEQRLETALLP
jgi:predicted kinase